VVDALDAAWQVADVVNNSWSYTSTFADNFLNASYAAAGAALERGVTEGRDGLGTVFVFSAGNSRGQGGNVNDHNFQNSPYTFAVAATDSHGAHASFSSPGSALLVAAPGVSVTTTDGNAGYAAVSGTSFSSPAVAGVVALMLEANEDLGYRDVQEILAHTARLTDAGGGDWQVNGAGLHFSHDYGFGLVDAEAAVRLAETWTQQSTFATLNTVSATRTQNKAIPDNNVGGVSDQVTIAATNDLVIDAVEVEVHLDHTWVGDLQISLISPSGTEAILADRPGGAFNSANDIDFTFSANTFWGEAAAGTWTLKIADLAAWDVGVLDSWTLDIHGDTVAADSLYVFTNEYGTLSGADLAQHGTLVDTVGHDTLNLSAVTDGVILDLKPGAGGTIAGHAFSLGSGTVIEDVILGAGDDVVTGNNAANTDPPPCVAPSFRLVRGLQGRPDGAVVPTQRRPDQAFPG